MSTDKSLDKKTGLWICPSRQTRRGSIHSKGTWQCAPHKGIFFRTYIFGNFGQGKRVIFGSFGCLCLQDINYGDFSLEKAKAGSSGKEISLVKGIKSRKTGQADGNILSMLAAQPYPKFGRDEPPVDTQIANKLTKEAYTRRRTSRQRVLPTIFPTSSAKMKGFLSHLMGHQAAFCVDDICI